jgi:hypothetical protein
MRRYYYSTDGTKVVGPVSAEDMQRLYAANILNDETQICEEGQSIWTSISEQVSHPRAQKVNELPNKVPANQREAPGKQRAEFQSTTPRNPLLVPFAILAALFILAIAGGAFYIGRRGVLPQATLSSPAPTPSITETTPIPVTATPQSPPAISEETKARVLDFIEKAAKLDNMADQGVEFAPFSDQLAEVKSAWQTLTLAGWPETWSQEKAQLESAIDGWTLANDIWGEKIQRISDEGTDVNLYATSATTYVPRMQDCAKTVASMTGSESAIPGFDIVYYMKTPTNITPDFAIKWCLSTASFCFEKARDGVKSHLSQ